MTLDQLRVFVAVAEREHLTQAAAVIHLTPSAVSASLAALEGRYDVRLFHRVGRRLELSEAGRMLLGEARAVLARAAAAERALSDLAGLVRGSLVLEASQTLASYWLPERLMRFRHAHPGVSVALREGNTRTVAAAVLDGHADLGFVEGVIDEPALAMVPLAEDRLVIVAGPDHQLTRNERIGAGDLLAARWVMREQGSGTRAGFEGALCAAGVETADIEVVLELPTNEAVCAAVRSGEALTVVSELVAQRHVEAGRLRVLAYPLPVRRFALLRHKERFQSVAAQAFAATLLPPGGVPSATR